MNKKGKTMKNINKIAITLLSLSSVFSSFAMQPDDNQQPRKHTAAQDDSDQSSDNQKKIIHLAMFDRISVTPPCDSARRSGCDSARSMNSSSGPLANFRAMNDALRATPCYDVGDLQNAAQNGSIDVLESILETIIESQPDQIDPFSSAASSSTISQGNSDAEVTALLPKNFDFDNALVLAIQNNQKDFVFHLLMSNKVTRFCVENILNHASQDIKNMLESWLIATENK
jgi:hypothetical protein